MNGDDITGDVFGLDKIGSGVYTTTAQDADEIPESPCGSESHIITLAMDAVIANAAAICTANNIPPPGEETYAALARPLIDTTAWETAPEMNIGSDTPKWMMIPVLLIALGLVFAPTIYAIYQRYQENKLAELAAAEAAAAQQPIAPPPLEPLHLQQPHAAIPQPETPIETSVHGI